MSLLKLISRRLSRNLLYAVTTISGLVVGLTTAILIFLWVSYELSYDRYDPENERVFAVLMHEKVEGSIETFEETPVPLMEFLTSDVPEVESVTRFDITTAKLTSGPTSIQKRGLYADSGYFKVFKPGVIQGNLSNPLADKHSIAISGDIAKMLFGNESAIGRIISLAPDNDFKVSAVFRSFPENSSLGNYDFVLPFSSRVRAEEEWQNYFVKLRAVSAVQDVQQKIDSKVHEYFGNTNTNAMLFALTDWRLHWSFENGKISGGRIIYVVLFSIAAVFILVMACVNYMNIATANAAGRAREIGVRKMTGATANGLMWQFMMESMVLTSVAACISIVAARLMLPLFSAFVRTPLKFSPNDPVLITGMLTITFVTAVLAGSYPALMLSSMKPARVLKGNIHPGLPTITLRTSLVIFQFAISAILIFSAIVVRQQTNFLLGKDLGFDKRNVINIWIDQDHPFPLQPLREEILQHAAVVSAGYGGASPMEVNGYASVKIPGRQGNAEILLHGATADPDMLPTLKLPFVKGRDFSREIASDSNAFIITESAARKLGLENPIGETIIYTMYGEQQGTIVGVIRDFQNEDIHAPMDPVIFVAANGNDLYNLFIRYADGRLDEALAHVKTVFAKFQPGTTLSYSFLDADFELQFYQERQLGKLSWWFTLIAIFIATLGLFGLVMFTTERRTKEIGIRKVHGASVAQIVMMLWRNFTLPAIIALAIAFPAGYWLMELFLADYAFRIRITAWPFALVGIGMIAGVLVTVSYQSVRAAMASPAKVLRSD